MGPAEYNLEAERQRVIDGRPPVDEFAVGVVEQPVPVVVPVAATPAGVVCTVESVRLWRSRDNKKSALRAFVTFVLAGRVKVIDATVKELEIRDRNAPADALPKGSELRVFMPGGWTGKENKRDFKPNVALHRDLLREIEPVILGAYHEKMREQPEGGEEQGSEWRS